MTWSRKTALGPHRGRASWRPAAWLCNAASDELYAGYPFSAATHSTAALARLQHHVTRTPPRLPGTAEADRLLCPWTSTYHGCHPLSHVRSRLPTTLSDRPRGKHSFPCSWVPKCNLGTGESEYINGGWHPLCTLFTNANFGKAFAGRHCGVLEDRCRKWMSGCENLLDSLNENRTLDVVQENSARTAPGTCVLEAGGLAVQRRLRRVIRRLPILGGDTQHGRLSPLAAPRYENTAKASRDSGGRPPALPLDFYLSWMSPFTLPFTLFSPIFELRSRACYTTEEMSGPIIAVLGHFMFDPSLSKDGGRLND